VSLTKGPYHRLVGRHTQHFCSKAKVYAATPEHKRVLFIAAAGADELLSQALGLKRTHEAKTSAQEPGASPADTPVKRVRRKNIPGAMRVYASTVLVLLGSDKDALLKFCGLDEAGWMKTWCLVFGYKAEDMRLFNQELLPRFAKDGPDALAGAAAGLISGLLFGPGDASVSGEDVSRTALHDASVITQTGTTE